MFFKIQNIVHSIKSILKTLNFNKFGSVELNLNTITRVIKANRYTDKWTNRESKLNKSM